MINTNEFRYDINALRAIAVIGVVFYHFKIPFCDGGFSGVDIFFVISGYLMSRIIFNELERDSFSYKSFLIRRIKRIVPALLFVVVVIIILCFFLYFPGDLKLQGTNAFYSLLFYSNFWYIKHSGYFDPLSSSNIFLHTWSLSVEFQFYILYPFFLSVLYKLVKVRSAIIFLLILTILLIFGIAVWRTHINAVASFYLLPTRSWELIIGGLVFMIEQNLVGEMRKKILAAIGYLIIALSYILLRSDLEWPGIYTWLPVGSTCLIMVSGVNDFKFIRFSLIQFLGKISYSLYLWHWPVLVIGQYIGYRSSILNSTMLILISIGLATFTYHFVETRSTINYKLAYSLFSGIALVYLFTWLPVNKFMFKQKSLELAAYTTPEAEKRRQFSEGKCYIVPGGEKYLNKEKCLRINPRKKNFLLLGDSHAAELSESLQEFLSSRNINLLIDSQRMPSSIE